MRTKSGYLAEVKRDIKKNAKSFKFVDNKTRVVFYYDLEGKIELGWLNFPKECSGNYIFLGKVNLTPVDYL